MRLRERFSDVGGGAPLLPLVILFGLNAVDELDRGAFGTLLPEIRDHFRLDLTGVTALSAAVIPAALLIGFPIARWADRHRRMPLVIGGAATWGVFSVFTGVASTVFLLGLARVGAGIGRAVNDPVHSSLLSDYYPPSSRAKIFSTHRAANTVGAFFGPVIAGGIAELVGWRTPFIVLAVPTFILIIFAATRMHEPPRTGHITSEGDVRLRQAFRMLWSVRTLRRIWFAFPFISFVVIGMGQIMSLYYKDVFDVGVGARGLIQSFDAPFIIIGLLLGAPRIERGMTRDPGRLMRTIGLAVVLIGMFMVGIAVAPQLWIAVGFSWGISVLGTVLYAGGFAILSLVAPPEARASAFACFSIASLLGVVALPVVGIVGDAVGLRWGLAVLAPIIVIGSIILSSAGRFVNDDIKRVHPEGADVDVLLPPAPPGPPE